jgi:putative transposase
LRKTYSIGVGELKTHIEKPGQDLPSIKRQATLLGMAKSSVYYQPVPIDSFTLSVMNKIDEIYTKRPFYGVRRITEQLRRDGILVNHKRIHHLMQEMGIQGLIPKRNLSKNDLPHLRYPYLLRNVPIVRMNQVWGTDITYIRMACGFVYLTVFMDWYTRFILSWRLSTTLERAFCLEAAIEAMGLFGVPEIVNQDQGVQYTHKDYCNIWEEKGVRISMDGRGRAMDNIFTERLWRTIKYEEVYLKSYETVMEAKQQIGEYITFYNNERFHQSLNNKTPAEIYFGKEENLV